VILAAVSRDDVADYVSDLFWVYTLLLFAYIILSMIYAFARVPYWRWLTVIFNFLRDICEPLLAPIRRVLPSFGPFDFSPIVALILLRIVAAIVVAIIRG
jgi:YggT family protein